MPSRGQYQIADVPVGAVFGQLTVLAARQPGDRSARVRCRCECGTETIVAVYRLLNGHTKSCGCLRHDFGRIHNTTHGYARTGRTPTYRSWCAMKSRCLNPNFPKYPQYGGRGISICERWLNFEDFLADMGERPEGTTLHRPNNDGDYEPGNCEWATAVRQARSKTTTKWVTFNGRTQSLADWATEIGISQFTLWNRLVTYGWSVEETLTLPVDWRPRDRRPKS